MPGPAEVVEPARARQLDTYARGVTRAAPAEQLAPHVVHAVAGGRQVISVQLHPSELGVVQIRITVDQDRKVRAVLSAGQPETVDLLQRHAQGLERALTAGGLSLADQDAVTFDLGTAGQGSGRSSDDRASGQASGQASGADRDERGPSAGTAWTSVRHAASDNLLDLVL
jgi:flagellar hook-length control protein FliK